MLCEIGSFKGCEQADSSQGRVDGVDVDVC